MRSLSAVCSLLPRNVEDEDVKSQVADNLCIRRWHRTRSALYRKPISSSVVPFGTIAVCIQKEQWRFSWSWRGCGRRMRR